MERKILITGGAGFIGSHLVRLMVNRYPNYLIVNLDALTYAGNPANLRDIEEAANYRFERGDICDLEAVREVFERHAIDSVIHLAAESHVDRSIDDPFAFARTNVLGTLTLLQVAKERWTDDAQHHFYHVSTDEVYGSLGAEGAFTESSRYEPHSPYSASKASSDHFVRAFHDTFGLPTVISNCSNNYGPYQFPEKLIPLFINNIRERRALPVYGRGENVRDWLYVEDHARAIDLIFHRVALARPTTSAAATSGAISTWCDCWLRRLTDCSGALRVKTITSSHSCAIARDTTCATQSTRPSCARSWVGNPR